MFIISDLDFKNLCSSHVIFKFETFNALLKQPQQVTERKVDEKIYT